MLSILWLIASSGTLSQLLTLWVGWELLLPELRVEISGGTLPTSSTCFESLELPAHFKTYMDFEKSLVSAINSAQTGFGLVKFFSDRCHCMHCSVGQVNWRKFCIFNTPCSSWLLFNSSPILHLLKPNSSASSVLTKQHSCYSFCAQ